MMARLAAPLVLVLGFPFWSVSADWDFLTAEEFEARIVGGTITGLTAEGAT